MSAPKVKLSELLDLLESDSGECVSWIDLQTGQGVALDRDLWHAAEQGDEEALSSVPDWQKPDAELARLIAADDGSRFTWGPKAFDFHEHRHMERFALSQGTEPIQDQLWQALKGKGAFRRFKDTAARLGLLDQWFTYRNEAMKKFIRAWATRHGIKTAE